MNIDQAMTSPVASQRVAFLANEAPDHEPLWEA